jgi:ribonuclease BN (tRNA processing enzyme)
MKLTVIGSADAFNSAGRGNSCYVLESAGAGKVMIDFGPTALLGLRRQGIPPNELSGVVFTHLHGDHTGGFPLLVIDALYNSRRQTELAVLGPTLTRQMLDGLMRVTYGDLKDAVDKGLLLAIDEFIPGEERAFHGYRVRAFAAEHMQLPHRPLCLRFEDPSGRAVAFSGDTRICPGLLAAADGADLLVADCSRLAAPAGQHATWEEWQAILPELKARSLLLTHLGLDVRAELPGLASSPAPLPLRFADDGLVVEL